MFQQLGLIRILERLLYPSSFILSQWSCATSCAVLECFGQHRKNETARLSPPQQFHAQKRESGIIPSPPSICVDSTLSALTSNDKPKESRGFNALSIPFQLQASASSTDLCWAHVGAGFSRQKPGSEKRITGQADPKCCNSIANAPAANGHGIRRQLDQNKHRRH